jgi:hypothetical protein
MFLNEPIIQSHMQRSSNQGDIIKHIHKVHAMNEHIFNEQLNGSNAK